MRHRTHLAAIVTTLAACSRAASTSTAGPDPATKGASTATSATPPDAGAEAGIVLPPVEDACTNDADCGVTSLDLTGSSVCCFRCCSMHGARPRGSRV